MNQKSGRFGPDKFEDHYETPAAGRSFGVIGLPARLLLIRSTSALRRSVGREAEPAKAEKPAGNADADRGQESEGSGAKENGSQAAALLLTADPSALPQIP